MARPIKETPILYGEDARVFEARMKNPPKESREKMEEINRDYNYIMSLGSPEKVCGLSIQSC